MSIPQPPSTAPLSAVPAMTHTAPAANAAPVAQAAAGEEELLAVPVKQGRHTPPRVPPRSHSPIVVPSSRSTRPTTPTSSIGAAAVVGSTPTPDVANPRSLTSTPLLLSPNRTTVHESNTKHISAREPPLALPASQQQLVSQQEQHVPFLSHIPTLEPQTAVPEAAVRPSLQQVNSFSAPPKAELSPSLPAQGKGGEVVDQEPTVSLTVILNGGAAASTGSRIFQLSLEHDDFPATLVADVKTALEEYCGVPSTQQLLMHRTAVLRDDQTLSDEGILPGAILSLEVAAAEVDSSNRKQQREVPRPELIQADYPDRTKGRLVESVPRSSETRQLEERVAALEDMLLSFGTRQGPVRGRSANDDGEIVHSRQGSTERMAKRSTTPPLNQPSSIAFPHRYRDEVGMSWQQQQQVVGFSVDEYEFDLLSPDEQLRRIEELQRNINQQQELLRWMRQRAKFAPQRCIEPHESDERSRLVMPSNADGHQSEDARIGHTLPATEAWRTRMRRAHNL